MYKTEKPAFAYCGECKKPTFQTVIGNRDTSGVLKCRGCGGLNDFTESRIPRVIIGTISNREKGEK